MIKKIYFTGIKKPELALVQIATNDDVYIIDVTTLGNCAEHLWTKLGTNLLNNRNIVKLGKSANKPSRSGSPCF